MTHDRRNFLKKAALGAIGGSLFMHPGSVGAQYADRKTADPIDRRLDEALSKPVLKRELFPDPVIIERVELIRYNDSILCRVYSTDGAEGLSVSNDLYMTELYPISTRRVQPVFVGKDARDLEEIIMEVYQRNYKLQGLGLWIPLATVELAVLDLLGQISGKPMGELFGEVYHTRIPLYLANDNRGRSAEESLDRIRRQTENEPFRALKFKVAGRMHDADYPAGRSERLIPMVREAFGENMTLYVDANSGYTVDEAIRIGKLLEEYNYSYFEEPVPFDAYEETRQVAEALNIPIAGGEQEPSMRNFRWLIKNDALQVLQPDQFYFGGMIMTTRVARMAAVTGKMCTPHMSGRGLGYLYMMHFVATLPNPARFHEFKGFTGPPVESDTSDLKIDENGTIKVPTGPGLGVRIDPDFINRHTLVEP